MSLVVCLITEWDVLATLTGFKIPSRQTKDLDRAKSLWRAWRMDGFFRILPILESAITIVLGLMRSNIIISITSISIGKILRYIILIFQVALIFVKKLFVLIYILFIVSLPFEKR